MKPLDGMSLIDPSLLRKDLIVADTVYSPEKTKLILDAEAAGCAAAIGGKGMLLWQGALNYELYTGTEMPVEDYQKFQAENAAK
jgi:shikimate dehydrogenase